MPDQPIIAYNNLLQGANYNILAGVDDPGAPLSDAWIWDMSRPALPQADSAGVLSFSINTPSGTGYGVDAVGNFNAFGDELTFGGLQIATAMILGASRNNPGGSRFSGGVLQVQADGVEVFSRTIYAPQNASALFQLAAHPAAATYTITISGLTPGATVRLPEIFIGPVMQMPFFELGLDAYGERFKETRFESGTGRIARSRRFVRIEKRLRWRYLDPQQQNTIRQFIETALESLRPFWLVEFPDSKPANAYLGFHSKDTSPLPLGAGMYVDFSLNFIEAL